MSVFYKYLKAIKTPFHSLSLPALAAWNAWKAQLLPSGLNHFFNKMVACSSEPVGDTFLWLTTSSGFLSMKLLTIESAYTPMSSIAPPARFILKKLHLWNHRPLQCSHFCHNLIIRKCIFKEAATAGFLGKNLSGVTTSFYVISLLNLLYQIDAVWFYLIQCFCKTSVFIAENNGNPKCGSIFFSIVS